MSEINLKWDKFSTYDRLSQRTSKWWETTHCSYSYNIHDPSTAKFQPGGTALLSLNQLAHKAQAQRLNDPTGLGRWSSTLYQGRQDKFLRIIQIYRPCRPNPHSANGAYQQHSRYFLSKQNNTCPGHQFLLDLKDFLQKCLLNHEQIIVMGDFNDEITQAPISTFFHSLDMHNIILSHSSHLPLQCHTYIRGHTTIDGVFATRGISASQTGYLPAHHFDTDHNAIWMDIALSSVFGHSNKIQPPLQCRRLKNEDPRVVEKFNIEYQKLLLHHKLPQALQSLILTIHNPLTTQQQHEYERLDRLRIKCLLQAEKKCRKLKTGAIDYSPTIQLQRDSLRFWKLILKRRKGQKIDTKYLSRLERRLNLSHTFQTPLNVIHQNIKDAHRQYAILKKTHSSLRDEWIEQLAAARAANGNRNSITELTQLRQREHLRRAYRQIKWCLHHDTTTGPITEVTEILDGQTLHHNNKFTVEQAILTANNKKYRQTNDTPPMTSLLPILGFLGTTTDSQKILQGTFTPPPLLMHTQKNSSKLWQFLPTSNRSLPSTSPTLQMTTSKDGPT